MPDDISFFTFLNIFLYGISQFWLWTHQKVTKIVSSKNKKIPINERIVASEIILIDQNGEKKGIVNLEEAIETAKSLSLDLVQVSSPDAVPVVCKILDHGKHLFNKKKNVSSSKSKTKRASVKEIKFRPTTDVADFNIKLKKIKNFILGGDKTKISVRFRGREILNSDMGLDLLNRLKAELDDIAQVDQDASLEGRQLLMILSPKCRK